MKKLFLLSLGLFLVGCKDEPPTASKIIEQFKSLGVNIQNVREEPRDSKALLPNSYSERLVFEIPDVAPNGGQIFVCKKKDYCDAILHYYEALGVVAVGPYLLQSSNGLVVGQFNKGLAPEVAEKMMNVIKKY